jgi:hypothetical protein
MRLSHSGKAFHFGYANQTQESFLDGHVRPELYHWCRFASILWSRIALTRGFVVEGLRWWSLITRREG